MTELDELLRLLVDEAGSDLHLRAGEPPVLRVNGTLIRTDHTALTAEDTKRLVCSLLNEERRAKFMEQHDLDISYATEFARFRVNAFRQQGQVGAVMHLIPIQIPTLDDLMLPPITKDLVLRSRGLLLVTGPTGSGKSTTLASLIDFINAQKRVHVMTIEDPIEFVHEDKLASVDQRELGKDTHSYAAALKHVLRQNPDVLFIGELCDAETIQSAVTAAEMGHLVLSTVHTTDAAQTLDRLVNIFPLEQQRQIRAQLAAVLIGIISQTLLPRLDEPGRIAAFEVMVATPIIRGYIRDGKMQQIITDIQTGSQYGMEAMDHSLASLVQRRLVRYEDALAKSSNPRDFEQRAGSLTGARR